MKKILSKGYISRYRIRCPYCDCEFEYQSNDVYHGLMDPGYTTVAYVDCPQCNRALFHRYSTKTRTRLSTESL